MSEDNPTSATSIPEKKLMPFWLRWIKVKIDSQVNIYVALLAIIVSCSCSIISLGFDYSQNAKQTNFDLTLAAFETGAQATSAYQAQQQLNIQSTQVAMQSQMDVWERQQALPFVKVVIPPEHIYTVDSIIFQKTSYGYEIRGMGIFNFGLANNGGVKAGVLDINWIKENKNANLLSLEVKFGDPFISLPTTIDAQTPVRVQLGLEASVPYNGDPTGKSDYQLGEYWKKELQSNPNYLTVSFSNTDPIDVEIDEIQLAMPEVSFQPDPPSLFTVTNKTALTIACFATNKKKFFLEAINLTSNEKAETFIEDGMCASFPKGEYQFTLVGPETGTKQNVDRVSLTSDNTVDINLADLSAASQASGDWKDNLSAYVWILFLPALISMLWKFFSLTFERGRLVVYAANYTDSVFRKIKSIPIQIFPWGFKTIIRFGDEKITLKLRKGIERDYVIQVLQAFHTFGNRNEIYDEISIKKNNPAEIHTGGVERYRISFNDSDKEELDEIFDE